MQTTMTKYPILIRFRDIIAGNGFLAHVIVDGRALLAQEAEDDFWVFGVQPGSVAGGASDAAAALAEFKTHYQSVLFDIAEDAKSFDEFQRNVSAFFNYVDQADLSAWNSALDAVRKTNVSLDDLPSVKAESVPCRFQVVEINHAQPALNELNEVARAA